MSEDLVRRVKLEGGMLFYQGVRMGILDFKVFSVVFKELNKLIGPTVGTIVYRAVKKQTIENTKAILASFGFKNMGDQRLDDRAISSLLDKGIMDLLSQFGWGSMKVVELDLEKEFIRLHVKNSLIADSYEEKQEHPVCHFTAGMIAGGIESVFGQNMDCREVKCKACGDEYCEFIVQNNFEII